MAIFWHRFHRTFEARGPIYLHDPLSPGQWGHGTYVKKSQERKNIFWSLKKFCHFHKQLCNDEKVFRSSWTLSWVCCRFPLRSCWQAGAWRKRFLQSQNVQLSWNFTYQISTCSDRKRSDVGRPCWGLLSTTATEFSQVHASFRWLYGCDRCYTYLAPSACIRVSASTGYSQTLAI